MLLGAETLLGVRSPIVGSPQEAAAAAQLLEALRGDLEGFRDFAGDSLEHLNPLRSRSVERLRERTRDELLGGARRLDSALDEGRRAFSRYAADIERIHARARAILDEVEACLREESAYASSGISASASGAQAERLRLARERWRRQIEERRDAERSLAAALRGSGLGPLLAARRLQSRDSAAAVVLGSGLLPPASATAPAIEEIAGGRLTANEAAAAWAQLGLTRSEVQALPVEVLAGLAGASGLPAWVQDLASRRVLDRALRRPEQAGRLLGLGDTPGGAEALAEELAALQGVLRRAERGHPGEVVQLLSLGGHDGRLVASISLGDLDAAERVGVIVSGMGSSAAGMGGAVSAAGALRAEAASHGGGQSLAVVAWSGYRSPPLPVHGDLGVLGEADARAGSVPLASFIDGVRAARAPAAPLDHLALFAHSYGSTTAAMALEHSRSGVDSFVAFGSAGLVDGVSPGELRAGRVFAVQAEGDALAPIGQRLSGRADPRLLPGVTEFSAEERGALRGVTGHGMLAPSASGVGYLSAGSAALAGMGAILATGDPEHRTGSTLDRRRWR